MSPFGIPFLLLASIWGVFQPLLKAIEIMDGKRDQVLDKDSKISMAHRQLLLYGDWLLTCVLTYTFVWLVGITVGLAPHFMGPTVIGPWDAPAVACYMLAGILLICGLAGFICGFCEYRVMQSTVAEIQNSTSATGENPEGSTNRDRQSGTSPREQDQGQLPAGPGQGLSPAHHDPLAQGLGTVAPGSLPSGDGIKGTNEV